MTTETTKILIANANLAALPSGTDTDPRVILVKKGKLLQLTSIGPEVARIVVYKPQGDEFGHLRKLNIHNAPVQQPLRMDTVVRALVNFIGVANGGGADEGDSDKSTKRGTGKKRPRTNPTRDFIRENLWRVEGKGVMEACRILHELGASQGLSAKLNSYPAYVMDLRKSPQPTTGVVTTGGEAAAQAMQTLEGLRGMLTSFHTQIGLLEKKLGLLAAENDGLRLGNQTLQGRVQILERDKTALAATIADLTERLRK